MLIKINRRQWLKSTALAGAVMALSVVDVLAAVACRGKGFVKLNMNENPYGISEKTAQAIRDAMSRANRYPIHAQEALQDLIAAHENVPSDCVLLGAGCTEIFCLASLLYGADGKEVLVAEPSYYLFNRYVEQLRGKLIRVPVNERWEIDLDAMAHRASKSTSFVYICNPNNPTSTIVDPVHLRQFCEDMPPQSIVFVDEAYIELAVESQRTSMVELVREGGNLVIGRTFSKLYGLAGLRIGYGIGNPKIITEMRRIQRNLAPVNELGIAAAHAAYVDADYIALTQQRNAKARVRFYAVLEKLGYKSILGSQTNFVTFQITGGARRLVTDLQQQYNICVYAFHFLEKDWVRVSMGTSEEMNQLTAALKELSLVPKS